MSEMQKELSIILEEVMESKRIMTAWEVEIQNTIEEKVWMQEEIAKMQRIVDKMIE